MDTDAKLDATFGRQTCVALDHAGLHLYRTADRIDDAAELDDAAVAGALEDPTVMRGDGGVDEITTESPQARQGAVLVRPGESAVTDNVGDQNRRELPGLGRHRHRVTQQLAKLRFLPGVAGAAMR